MEFANVKEAAAYLASRLPAPRPAIKQANPLAQVSEWWNKLDPATQSTLGMGAGGALAGGLGLGLSGMDNPDITWKKRLRRALVGGVGGGMLGAGVGSLMSGYKEHETALQDQTAIEQARKNMTPLGPWQYGEKIIDKAKPFVGGSVALPAGGAVTGFGVGAMMPKSKAMTSYETKMRDAGQAYEARRSAVLANLNAQEQDKFRADPQNYKMVNHTTVPAGTVIHDPRADIKKPGLIRRGLAAHKTIGTAVGTGTGVALNYLLPYLFGGGGGARPGSVIPEDLQSRVDQARAAQGK